MRQLTLASQAIFEKHGRKCKREMFLDQMEQVVPWSSLLALVEPHYPKAGNGRQPVGVTIMLRTYFLQQWFGFSDPGMEEAFADIPLYRGYPIGELVKGGSYAAVAELLWIGPPARASAISRSLISACGTQWFARRLPT